MDKEQNLVIVLLFGLILNFVSCYPPSSNKELKSSFDNAILIENYEEAISAISELINRYPNCESFYFERAVTYYNLNSVSGDSLLILDLEKISDTSKFISNSYFINALTSARQGDYLNALKTLEQIKKETIMVAALKGHIYYMNNNYAEAILEYDYVLNNNLPIDFATKIYYLRIYSKYLNNDIIGALWDCGAMEQYGIKNDELLITRVANDSLNVEKLNLITFESVSIEGIVNNGLD